MKDSTLSILGAGYVGLTTAALLANAGYTVYLVEPNQERLKIISSGKSFFFEKGLDKVIANSLKSHTLIPTSSYKESIPKSSIIFSCVGTPDNPDGSSNLTYVFSAAEQAIPYLQTDSIYVQKSTVPVGTGKQIEMLFTQSQRNIAYVSNPEFLREGTALSDTLYFDRIVAGGRNQAAVTKVLNVYRQLQKNRDKIAQLAQIPHAITADSYITTNLNSAELIKVTSNAFLALKISFANSIAKLADQANADITEVMDAVGADPRIGRSFLHAGRGYGGGCFPKDVSGLIMSGLEHGVDLEILSVTQGVNASMPGYIVEKIRTKLNGSLTDRKVAVLGLAFKAGTSDVRRSPGILIANLLSKSGAKVSVHDPVAGNEAANDLHQDITLINTLEQTIKDVDAIVLATDWPEYANLDPVYYKKLISGNLIVDATNKLEPDQIKAAGLRYIGVGRPDIT